MPNEADTCRLFITPRLQTAGWDCDPHSIEFDYTTGIERELSAFPTPNELWARLRSSEPLADDTAVERLLAPVNLTTGKEPRYYQQIAINLVVQSILQGKQRILLTMATGTGKTVVAFHISWKLWSSKWNRNAGKTGSVQRKPRILYLADRNFLVDDPKDKIFAPFVDARHKIEGGNAIFSRELYFATYQSIAKDERRPGLYREFAPDFFDLIIVDECHRGSAKEDSNWSDAAQRAEIIQQLAERGIDFQQVAAQAGRPDADPFDLLCHLAFNAPVRTRRQRADRVKQEQTAFFAYFAPEAREILNDLLEQYAADGELQFTLPDVLKVPPISQHGNVAEIMDKFGGADQLRNAVNQMQTLLYAA